MLYIIIQVHTSSNLEKHYYNTNHSLTPKPGCYQFPIMTILNFSSRFTRPLDALNFWIPSRRIINLTCLSRPVKINHHKAQWLFRQIFADHNIIRPKITMDVVLRFQGTDNVFKSFPQVSTRQDCRTRIHKSMQCFPFRSVKVLHDISSGCAVHLSIAIQFRSQFLSCQMLVDLLRIGARDKLDNNGLVGIGRRVESGKKELLIRFT